MPEKPQREAMHVFACIVLNLPSHTSAWFIFFVMGIRDIARNTLAAFRGNWVARFTDTSFDSTTIHILLASQHYKHKDDMHALNLPSHTSAWFIFFVMGIRDIARNAITAFGGSRVAQFTDTSFVSTTLHILLASQHYTSIRMTGMNFALVVCMYTVEPPSKWHFGTNINSGLLSFIEDLSLATRKHNSL